MDEQLTEKTSATIAILQAFALVAIITFGVLLVMAYPIIGIAAIFIWFMGALAFMMRV